MIKDGILRFVVLIGFQVVVHFLIVKFVVVSIEGLSIKRGDQHNQFFTIVGSVYMMITLASLSHTDGICNCLDR
jgi:hypothetical protein